MPNGSRLQITTTIIASIFVAGTVWNRISMNAAAMRMMMEEIRTEQREMRKQLDELIRKP
jgi:hypothetical protein